MKSVRWVGAGVLAVAVAGAFVWRSDSPGHRADVLLREARSAFQAKRYDEAVRVCERVLELQPEQREAIILAGGAAAADGKPDRAWEFYAQIRSFDDIPSANAGCVAAHLLTFDLHRLADAESLYRRVLECDPAHPEANSGYATLLGLTGRRWEAGPYTLELIRQGRCSTNQLILIGSETGGHDQPDLLEACIQSSPEDPIAVLGAAWHAHRAMRMDEAQSLAERACQLDPSLLSAQALVGNLLAERPAARDEFLRWHSRLPETADCHPEIWLARGVFAQHDGANETAIRCYWETLRRNPNYRVALYQLSQLLVRRGDVELAAPFLKRSKELQRLKEAEAQLFEGTHESSRPIQRVAAHLETLGRFWEAWGWCQVASQVDPQAQWTQSLTQRIETTLESDSPLTLEEKNPACVVDLAKFPVPDWSRKRSADDAQSDLAQELASTITFQDDAAAAGIDFTYFNSADPDTPGQKMYEFSGGGVGGFDYDGDGWCDLYWTQGSRWPVREDSFEHLDRLYRNRGDGQFEDVTLASGIRENRFSQGLAAGDFDNDGFPDLFVGNIRGNRLYRNEGDGTFTDVTHKLPNVAGRWTTSCAMADLNGDSWPDLYAANYVEGHDVFERMCQHKDGVPRMCAPFDFEGAGDQFFLSTGDGSFVDATASAGFAVPHGKGLGLLVADYQHTGRLSVFVANDLVPNFFFANRTAQRGAAPRFEEMGLVSGLALDARGQAQGCMGIAADDMNGDGWMDLFVTNFYMESNTLYLQLEVDAFLDATAEAGLVEPSLRMLGFGTQTVDADLDGIRDLVVTNGHVDDHRAYGQPYAMRPQVFRGLPGGRFTELASESIGPFFEREYLGRGMARLDWNRDGREDVAISHLESKSALLTNTTSTAGNSLTLHLRGTVSDRDAIGAVVTVRTSAVSQTRQLTAGDGYQSSNQHALTFGLGRDDLALEVAIRWPSGIQQTFENAQGRSEWLCIEQRPELVEWNATPVSP